MAHITQHVQPTCTPSDGWCIGAKDSPAAAPCAPMHKACVLAWEWAKQPVHPRTHTSQALACNLAHHTQQPLCVEQHRAHTEGHQAQPHLTLGFSVKMSREMADPSSRKSPCRDACRWAVLSMILSMRSPVPTPHHSRRTHNAMLNAPRAWKNDKMAGGGADSHARARAQAQAQGVHRQHRQPQSVCTWPNTDW